MKPLYNVYCDESCHLESQRLTEDNRFMVLGGIACSEDNKAEVIKKIKTIKTANGLTPHTEVISRAD